MKKKITCIALCLAISQTTVAETSFLKNVDEKLNSTPLHSYTASSVIGENSCEYKLTNKFEFGVISPQELGRQFNRSVAKGLRDGSKTLQDCLENLMSIDFLGGIGIPGVEQIVDLVVKQGIDQMKKACTKVTNIKDNIIDDAIGEKVDGILGDYNPNKGGYIKGN